MRTDGACGLIFGARGHSFACTRERGHPDEHGITRPTSGELVLRADPPSSRPADPDATDPGEPARADHRPGAGRERKVPGQINAPTEADDPPGYY